MPSLYIDGLTLQSLGKDRKTIAAATRELEIIGEAVSQLPEEIKQKYPQISWQRVKDFRNVVVHQYLKVDIKILWDIITEKLPALQIQIEEVLIEEKGKK